MLQRNIVDDALDNHELWALMTNGRYWKCRRNGRTRLWKTNKDRFKTPFKCGLYIYGAVTETSVIGIDQGYQYVISASDPNPK